MGLFSKRKTPEFPESWPRISVVVPSYNEEKNILNKLNNIKSLDYQRDLLEVVFVDGGSTDCTFELLESNIEKDDAFRLVKCPEKGKINQLNYIFPQLSGDLILITDVDACLSSDALKWIVAEFNSSDDIFVVGAYSMPEEAIEIEKYHWSSQNKGRFFESDAMSSSIVIAQGYAFKKELLSFFPEDVVADDIYVAFFAHARGKRVVYSRYAKAIETRNSKNLSDFIPHKFRKSNAFIREMLRFLYLLPEMNFFCKMMFITRLFQQLFLPWVMLLWFLLAGAFITMFRYDLVAFCFLFLLAMFFITSRIFASVKLPGDNKRFSLITLVKGYILILVIMLATGISYTFFKQGSDYSRVR